MFQFTGSRGVQNEFLTRKSYFIPAGMSGNNVIINATLGCNFNVTLTANSTLTNMVNALTGQSGVIKVQQDATGSRTLAYGSQYFFDGDTAFTIGTTANKNSVISWMASDPQHVLLSLIAVNTSW